jgi:hypothetical protein
MAIEINLSKDKNDVYYAFNKAYLKIHSIEIKTHTANINEQVWIKYSIWANKESRDTINDSDIKNWASSIKKDVIRTSILVLSQHFTEFSANGLLTAAYNYLKSLNKYSGVDV